VDTGAVVQDFASLSPPYLLFLGDATLLAAAKTAAGVHQWRPEHCLGQLRINEGNVDLGLPDMTPAQASARGAKTMVLGVANPGGVIPESWVPTLVEALANGLDLASGAHQKLSSVPPLKAAAVQFGRRLFDVRHTDQVFETGTGVKRTGRRLLTVGSDCVVGKKYTALAIERVMRARGLNADFRATGQTGILIAGRGVAIDAVVSDFIAGAAEWLSPDNDADHWDIIEGQGSLFHPAYAGVTLGLIHGSQPDALVVCHEPIRDRILSVDYPTPPLLDCIAANVAAARLTNPNARAVGVSINTSRMEGAAIERAMDQIERETGLPCTDPIRHGPDRIVDYLLATS